MSEELTILESCLKEAETGLDCQEDVCMPDAAQTNTETAIQSLIETLRGRDFSSAITQVKVFRQEGSNPANFRPPHDQGTSLNSRLFISSSGPCGPTTSLAARKTTRSRPFCTSTSVTRRWVRRAAWRWWGPAGICLRPAAASWSSTCRSARL